MSQVPVNLPYAPVHGASNQYVAEFYKTYATKPLVDSYAWLNNVDLSFADLRAATPLTHNSTATVFAAYIVSSTTINQFSELRRGILLFDLTGLSGTTVQRATLELYASTKYSQLGSTSFCVTAVTTASNTSTSASDFVINNFGTLYASAEPSGTGAISIDLPIAAITLGGYTKLGLLCGWDYNNAFGGSWSSSKTSGWALRSNESTAQNTWLKLRYT